MGLNQSNEKIKNERDKVRLIFKERFVNQLCKNILLIKRAFHLSPSCVHFSIETSNTAFKKF